MVITRGENVGLDEEVSRGKEEEEEGGGGGGNMR